MAPVAVQQSDDHGLGPRLLDLDSDCGTSRAARIAGWTLITVVVVGAMALWTQPPTHANYLRPNESSLTVLALPALRPLAFGARPPFDSETGPTLPAHAMVTTQTAIIFFVSDIRTATGDTDTTQRQAPSIGKSFGFRITQDPTA